MLSRFIHVRFFAILCMIALQDPLSMEFSRQGYWSGLPCPPPGDLPDPGILPTSLCLLHWQVGSFPLPPLRKSILMGAYDQTQINVKSGGVECCRESGLGRGLRSAGGSGSSVSCSARGGGCMRVDSWAATWRGRCLLIGQMVSTFPNECSYCSSIYIHFERVLPGCLQVALLGLQTVQWVGDFRPPPPPPLWPQNRALKLHTLTSPIVLACLRSASSGLTAERLQQAHGGRGGNVNDDNWAGIHDLELIHRWNSKERKRGQNCRQYICECVQFVVSFHSLLNSPLLRKRRGRGKNHTVNWSFFPDTMYVLTETFNAYSQNVSTR